MSTAYSVQCTGFQVHFSTSYYTWRYYIKAKWKMDTHMTKENIHLYQIISYNDLRTLSHWPTTYGKWNPCQSFDFSTVPLEVIFKHWHWAWGTNIFHSYTNHRGKNDKFLNNVHYKILHMVRCTLYIIQSVHFLIRKNSTWSHDSPLITFIFYSTWLRDSEFMPAPIHVQCAMYRL